MPDSIEVLFFDEPSGNVRGLVTAFAMINGRRKRIAHATLLTDGPTTISLELPKKVQVDKISTLIEILNNFATRLNEADLSTETRLSL